jgi:hypothetical protein
MRLLEGGATSGAAVILLAILTAGSAVLGAAEAPGAAGPSRPLPSSAAQPPRPSLPTTTPMPGSPIPIPPGQLTVNARAWAGHGNLAFDDIVAAQPGSAHSPATPPARHIGVVSVSGGQVTIEYQVTEAGLELAGRWPDGAGLLFWEDSGYSASLVDALQPWER